MPNEGMKAMKAPSTKLLSNPVVTVGLLSISESFEIQFDYLSLIHYNSIQDMAVEAADNLSLAAILGGFALQIFADLDFGCSTESQDRLVFQVGA